jgi:hypothetical protein
MKKTLFIVALGALVITAFDSCRATGYGCNGRSKCMTRVR